jgi:RNA polymerase sigma factor (sigma-70 family)
MDKEKAMEIIYKQYLNIKQIVYLIEQKYFNPKYGIYEDITHDVLIKIDTEFDKIKNDSPETLKLLDRFSNGHLSYIYKMAKNTYLNFLKREKKYTFLNYKGMTENERKKLIEMPRVFEKEENIYQQVDDYVNTFYWFDRKLFDLYRYEFKLHKTNMSKKTNISYSTIYRTVKRCKLKIKDKLKDQYYE